MNREVKIHGPNLVKISHFLLQVFYVILVFVGINGIGATLGIGFYLWQPNLLGALVAGAILFGSLVVSLALIKDAEEDGVIHLFSGLSGKK